MEALLARRIVSLSWRLLRAQRMQDAAIEALCANYVEGPCLHDILERVARTVGRTKEDRPGPDDELTLGLALLKDFAQERALERLLAYEQKIEGSLYKAMAELEKLRRVRRSDGPAAQNKANLQGEGQRGKGTEAQREPQTPGGQNEANLDSEQAAGSRHQAAVWPSVQNKANLQGEGQRGKDTEAQSGPAHVEPGVQNKANSAEQQPDAATGETAAGPVPAGT
jgi:hypothetical protein